MSYTPNKYTEAYRHPEWQKMRLKIMQRDGFQCIYCFESEKTLNVHHSYYVRDRAPWKYPEFSLSTLCEKCHEAIHASAASGRRMEWEDEMDLVLLANPEFALYFYHPAEAIHRAARRAVKQGIRYADAMREIEKACEGLFLEVAPKANAGKRKAK